MWYLQVLKENKIIARRSGIIEDNAETDTKLSATLKEIEELTNNLEKEKAAVSTFSPWVFTIPLIN